MSTTSKILTNIPSCLSRVKNPPKSLFYRGNLDFLNSPKVAIVGSRKVTQYTKSLILSLSGALKKRGVCVVSGAAIGADIASHIGAYPHTIAVFANGLDRIYPMQNASVIKQMYENSLALSEYEDGKEAKNWQFLERNRIVVGLCDAVVIAQADLNSGSMNSAKIAYESGIELFVLPQRINESSGTNRLLAQKRASIIDNIDEFAAKFGLCGEVFDDDEVLEFVRKNSSFNECLARFGDKIYEYELDGKIAIDGVNIRIL